MQILRLEVDWNPLVREGVFSLTVSMKNCKFPISAVCLLMAVASGAHAAIADPLAPAKTALHSGDAAAAVKYLLPLAEQGNPEAQLMLVSAYQGIDQKQAAAWLHTAAGNRQPDACHILGTMYLNGTGIGEDPQLAKKWLLCAAEQGVKAAQLHLGILLREGPNSLQDDREAYKWMKKAADAGDAEAQFRLAEMYRYGYGVAADAGEVQKWLKLAAQQGHPKAQQKLAEISR